MYIFNLLIVFLVIMSSDISSAKIERKLEGSQVIIKKASSLENIHFNEYIGKEVSLLTEKLEREYEITKKWVDEPPFVLKGISLYTANYRLDILISPLNYQESFNPRYNWSYEKFKKEKIGAVILFKDYKIIQFCE